MYSQLGGGHTCALERLPFFWHLAQGTCHWTYSQKGLWTKETIWRSIIRLATTWLVRRSSEPKRLWATLLHLWKAWFEGIQGPHFSSPLEKRQPRVCWRARSLGLRRSALASR